MSSSIFLLSLHSGHLHHHQKYLIILSLTLAEGELLIIAVRTPKAWTVIPSTPLSQTYDTSKTCTVELIVLLQTRNIHLQ